MLWLLNSIMHGYWMLNYPITCMPIVGIHNILAGRLHCWLRTEFWFLLFEEHCCWFYMMKTLIGLFSPPFYHFKLSKQCDHWWTPYLTPSIHDFLKTQNDKVALKKNICNTWIAVHRPSTEWWGWNLSNSSLSWSWVVSQYVRPWWRDVP